MVNAALDVAIQWRNSLESRVLRVIIIIGTPRPADSDRPLFPDGRKTPPFPLPLAGTGACFCLTYQTLELSDQFLPS